MIELKFKSNINCNNCIEKVKPVLNRFENIEWNVDTGSPDKILTIKGEFDVYDIESSLKNIGFNIEEIQ